MTVSQKDRQMNMKTYIQTERQTLYYLHNNIVDQASSSLTNLALQLILFFLVCVFLKTFKITKFVRVSYQLILERYQRILTDKLTDIKTQWLLVQLCYKIIRTNLHWFSSFFGSLKKNNIKDNVVGLQSSMDRQTWTFIE